MVIQDSFSLVPIFLAMYNVLESKVRSEERKVCALFCRSQAEIHALDLRLFAIRSSENLTAKLDWLVCTPYVEPTPPWT